MCWNSPNLRSIFDFASVLAIPASQTVDPIPSLHADTVHILVPVRHEEIRHFLAWLEVLPLNVSLPSYFMAAVEVSVLLICSPHDIRYQRHLTPLLSQLYSSFSYPELWLLSHMSSVIVTHSPWKALEPCHALV